MTKAVLVTIVLALVFVPIWASGDASARRGLKKTIVGIIAFNLFYLFLTRVVVPRLG